MTVVTEAELRDQLRRPTLGATIKVPAGARLTPSARDFVKQWQLNRVDPSEPEPGTAPAVSSPSAPQATPDGGETADTSWQQKSVFPINRPQHPRCDCCGGELTRKGDNMTQLNDEVFVVKTHPRIRLRGKFDSLHALVLMTECQARSTGPDWLAESLAILAAYCRELTSAEYHQRVVAPLSLPGWDEKSIHKATHDPESVLGVPHETLDGSSPVLSHWLNLCRASSRELEIEALTALPSQDSPFAVSLNHALNRLSSAFYFLQLRLSQTSRKSK